MLSDSAIKELFRGGVLFQEYELGDHPGAPAALPDAALDALVSIAKAVHARSIFEFGSGRSTIALLKAGFEVVSLEDKARWMNETKKQIPASLTSHRSLVKPLSTVWHNGVPFLDWRIDAALAELLRAADVILIDSPYYPPFRESTLISALTVAAHALVILDDTRIPTLSRFCDRIAGRNPQLLHRRVRVGHALDIFSRLGSLPIDTDCSLLDVLKGWRRYCYGRRLLAKN